MPLLKAIHVGLTGILAAAGVAAATGSSGEALYKGYEMPPYQVERSLTAPDGTQIELRRYAPHILAEVTVAGGQGAAVNRGFRELAGYIFGRNATGEKIAMTTPVAQLPSANAANPASESWTIRFMMPAAFSLASLPDARSEAIRFFETAPERQLVIRYSGLRTDARVNRFTQMLMSEAAARDLTPHSEPRYYFYDAPMTAPWDRRNEIAIVVGSGGA